MSMQELSEFERGLMDALLAGDDPFLAQLRRQLQAATVKSRELTGCGFYIEFSVPESESRVDPPEFKIGDVQFEIDGLPNGGGAILHGERGELGTHEAYSYDSTWPTQTRGFQIGYFGGGRDIKGLLQRIRSRE